MLKYLRNELQHFKFGKNRIGKKTICLNTYMRLHEDLQAFTWIFTWHYTKTCVRLRETYKRLLEHLRDFTWTPTCHYMKTYERLREYLHDITWRPTCFYMRPTSVYVRTYMTLHDHLHAITRRSTSVYVNTHVILHEDLRAFTWDQQAFALGLTWFYKKTYKSLSKNIQRKLLNIYNSTKMFRTIT